MMVMKHIVALVVSLLCISSILLAQADDLGVQVIGGDDGASMPVSLDDVQLGTPVEIPGWGEITPRHYDVQDCFLIRKKGVLGGIWKHSGSAGSSWLNELNRYVDFDIECDKHGDEEYKYYSSEWLTHNESKSQADFALLHMDIMNITSGTKDFGSDVVVKIVFDDEVEYQGWFRQKDYDLNICSWIDPENNFPIEPYYVGHYVFGCTLPNPVIESKKPLRMEISIDGNEITYNIRK